MVNFNRIAKISGACPRDGQRCTNTAADVHEVKIFRKTTLLAAWIGKFRSLHLSAASAQQFIAAHGQVRNLSIVGRYNSSASSRKIRIAESLLTHGVLLHIHANKLLKEFISRGNIPNNNNLSIMLLQHYSCKINLTGSFLDKLRAFCYLYINQ